MNQKEYTGRSLLAELLGTEPVDPRSATVEECRRRCNEIREDFGFEHREPKPDDDFLGLALDLHLAFMAWMERESKRLERKMEAMHVAGECTLDEVEAIRRQVRPAG